MNSHDTLDPSVPIIELRGVTKTYYNGDLSTTVLHGIDLKIYPGEFVAIIGASGSGKSTMMNILGALDRPTTGQYLFRGRDVSDFDRDELSDLRRESFGFVFQSYNLISACTAAENVEIPAMYAGVELHARHERSRELLTRLGLEERVYFRPKQLSGGQQQRVSISRALMNGGEIILADEPTGALDSKSGVEVMKLLDELSEQGHTVILITHAQEVADHARRVIEIRDGNIVSDPGPKPPKDAPPVHSWTARRGTMSGFAEAFESAKGAVLALRTNILRSILTLLGIVIGVGSVITMLAIGDGAKKQVVDAIGSLGANLLNINAGGGGNQRGGDRGTGSLTLGDVTALDTELNNVIAAVPYQESTATFRYQDRDIRGQVIGTSAKFPVLRAWPIAEGTFFEDTDDNSYAAVAVLGRTIADTLFPDGENPLGQYILMNNLSFQVIGVMTRKGASPNGQDQDEVIIIPYKTNQLRVTGQRFVGRIQVAVDDIKQIMQTQADIEALMAERHGQVDFRIFNMGAMLDQRVEQEKTMTVLLGSIAAISLLVGGIGVMNIMLVSVTERTREIGIRMATGARTRNIMTQFLIEALVVSTIGGAIGVALGLGAAWVVDHFFARPIAYTLFPVLLAFGSAFAIGLIFGFLPARKAAYLDPVVALQSE
ncbi:MAG: MacB family efflux pump subunit [Nevskiaceae bacterium]|jgi:macrolide transport system ATP-binding/permease protein|nr:MacB family efflux pump subunit [Nevskiaceae bacterium]